MSITGPYRRLPVRCPTLPPATHTNCYLIGHEAALLVDPGSPYPTEIDRLQRAVWDLLGAGGAVQAILLTHHHRDHLGGAALLARALRVPIAAHPQTIALLPAALRQLSIPPRLIADGERIELESQLTLEAHLTPGHTPGHLCLFDRQRRVLLSGDMIPGTGTTIIDPPEGEMGAYLRSLGQLSDLAPSLILPAHGPPIRDAQQAATRLIQHRRWREHRVLAALRAAPRGLWEITKQAYDDTSPVLFPLASRSALAHLIKLEHDGRAHRDLHGAWRRAYYGD